MHRPPFGKIPRQRPPLAVTPKHIQYRAEHLVQAHRSRLGAFFMLCKAAEFLQTSRD
jgi:hypothetical protein